MLTQTRGLDKREANNFLSRHRRKSNRGGEKLKIAQLRIVIARINNEFNLNLIFKIKINDSFLKVLKNFGKEILKENVSRKHAIKKN